MTVVQRQLWWLGWFLVLLVTTVATLFWLPYHASPLHVVLPLLLTYGWVRFVFTIWKPLYREEVTPGWSATLFFAGFAIYFMLGIVYRVASGHIE